MPAPARDQISLAAWSLSRSFFQAKRWTNLELPRIVREEFGIGALEFVNQFFENPSMRYLNQLRKNGAQHGVKFVRIMVDDEGNMAAVDRKERMEAAVAHRKWVDIAHYLGCRDIRCNMRGGPPDWKHDADLTKRAGESFRDLLDYSKASGLDIVIENHGGSSSDPGVLSRLMKEVNDPRFGTLPDFGNVNPGDDHYSAMRQLLPWAKGVSVKGMWKLDKTHQEYDLDKMIGMVRDSGFHGYWGIESSMGNQRRVPGQPPPPAPPADELWRLDLEGVRLTKAAIVKGVPGAV